MEVIMTRDDVLKLFPDATDEQITHLLNQNNSEVAKEKNKANQYKDKANSADELQKKLDELEAGQLTEVEKANKALEAANEQIAKLQKDNAIRDQREAAMTNFKITADQAKSVVKDDGSLDTNLLERLFLKKRLHPQRQRKKRLPIILPIRAAEVQQAATVMIRPKLKKLRKALERVWQV